MFPIQPLYDPILPLESPHLGLLRYPRHAEVTRTVGKWADASDDEDGLGLTLKTSLFRAMWGFPKIRGTFLGVPIIRTIVFGGL